MAPQTMKKLNQVLSVAKSVQTKRETDLTRVFQDVQKQALTSGFSKTYKPKFEGGEVFPPQSQKVQVIVEDALSTAATALKEIFNVVALKDNTNMSAKADVVVDNEVVLKDVPAVHLLFLEKRAAGIIDLINHLPVLSQDASWTPNQGSGLWETQPSESFKTRKIENHVVIVPPTDKHPAQVVMKTVDENIGVWSETSFSGAITADRKKRLLARAEKIQQAVKIAREEANQAEVVPLATGTLVDFIFGP